MALMYPALLSLDFERNEIRRYARYAADGVTLTHRIEPSMHSTGRLQLRGLFSEWEIEKMRQYMPETFRVN